jgi:hypothetical protein
MGPAGLGALVVLVAVVRAAENNGDKLGFELESRDHGDMASICAAAERVKEQKLENAQMEEHGWPARLLRQAATTVHGATLRLHGPTYTCPSQKQSSRPHV